MGRYRRDIRKDRSAHEQYGSVHFIGGGHAEEADLLDPKAVGRPEPFGLGQNAIQDHRKCHVEQCEEDRPVLTQQEPEEKCKQAGSGSAADKQNEKIVYPENLHHRDCISAEAEEQRVPERHKPCTPQDQQTDRDTPARQRLQTDTSHPFFKEEVKDKKSDEADCQPPECFIEQAAHIFLALIGANSPSGRKISTSAMIA